MFRCKTKTWITCGCLPLLFILLLTSCTNVSETSPTATISPFNRVVFRDGFDSQNGNWTTYSGKDGSAFYENGKLHIKNYTASVSPSLSYYIQEQFSEFALEVDMELVSGSSANWQEVICRYGPEGCYMFCINANGNYSIVKSVGGVATMLRAPTPSSHIKTGLGVTNNIRVECIGNSLTLYVNGFSVAQVSDKTLVTGYVGFSVDSQSGEYSEAAFDNVVIWTS